jgi:uncharacterized protein DUF4389
VSDPVTLTVERPPFYRREQVALRLVLLVLVGWIGNPFGLLWLGVPAFAAVLIATKDGRRYIDEDGPMLVRALSWILSLLAYLALLTDRLPGSHEQAVHLDVEPAGTPTVGSALARILRSIPSLLALAVLVIVGAVVWVIAVVLILTTGTYPETLWRFLLGLVRWQARALAYLASLVDHYPPFHLETLAAGPRQASGAGRG